MAQKIVIVGGGIIGAMAAFQLAKRGAGVTIIDAGLGRATDASFGWVNASFFLSDDHYRLRAAGIAAYARLSEQIAVPTTRSGSLVWDDAGDAFDAQLAKLAQLGADVQVVDQARIAQLEPRLGNPPDRAMLFASEMAVESGLLTDQLIAAVKAAGGRVIAGVPVTGITDLNGRSTGVQTPHGTINADRVLIAAGTGTARILDAVGVRLPMLKRPGLMLRTRPVAPMINHILASPTQELRQLPDGSILAPLAAGHQSDDTSVVGDAPDHLADLATARLNHMLPDANLVWDQVMVADRPMPADGFPVVGDVGPAGLYVGVMHSGMTLAAVMGELIAGEMLDGVSNQSADMLAPYRPHRFGGHIAAAPAGV